MCFLCNKTFWLKILATAKFAVAKHFRQNFVKAKLFFPQISRALQPKFTKKYLILFSDKVKGTVSRDFLEHFFHNFIPNGPLIHMPWYFRMLSRFRGDNCVWKGLRSAISYRHRESPAQRCQWHAESVLMPLPNVVIYQSFFSLQFKIRNFWKN